MAIYPCDFGHHRYPEPQQSLYLIWATDGAVGGNILRLCPRHFRDEVQLAAQHLALVDDNSMADSSCSKCGGDRVGVMFARFFPSKSDEIQYGADLCLTCSETVGTHMRASNGRPMRARLAG